MATFNFPMHQFETEYPEDNGFRTKLGGGYSYAAKPTAPDQRKFTLSFDAMRYFLDSNNQISLIEHPEFNFAVLESFYNLHKLHEPFIYPHPVYGNLVVKFNKALRVPKGIKDGNGLLQPFQLEFIEQPGIFVNSSDLPVGEPNPYSGTRRSTVSEILTKRDNHKTIINDSSEECIYVIQLDSLSNWEDDTIITIYVKGTSNPIFIAQEGVTIRKPEGLQPAGQYGSMAIHRIGVNEWAQM